MAKKKIEELLLLNPEQIAARRVPIEDAEVVLQKNSNWLCPDCQRRFAGENGFMKHHCEPRRRREMLASTLGQAAYGYYQTWMRARKFSIPNAAAFSESKFFKAFMKFAQFVIDANIPNPEKYIALMIEGEIQPVLWCADGAYVLYTRWIDLMTKPIDQVMSSIGYLLDICEKEDAAFPEIFVHLGPARLLQLIRQRRLSPWFLFCSSKFGKILKSLDEHQLKAFNAVVNTGYWADRFNAEQNIVKEIKALIKDFQL